MIKWNGEIRVKNKEIAFISVNKWKYGYKYKFKKSNLINTSNVYNIETYYNYWNIKCLSWIKKK